MVPNALGLSGSTQPELFQGTIDSMASALRNDPAAFRADALARDGPIEIWVIAGERWLEHGNHRFHAAAEAGADIPAGTVIVVDRTGSAIPTFRFQDVIRLPGTR